MSTIRNVLIFEWILNKFGNFDVMMKWTMTLIDLMRSERRSFRSWSTSHRRRSISVDHLGSFYLMDGFVLDLHRLFFPFLAKDPFIDVARSLKEISLLLFMSMRVNHYFPTISCRALNLSFRKQLMIDAQMKKGGEGEGVVFVVSSSVAYLFPLVFKTGDAFYRKRVVDLILSERKSNTHNDMAKVKREYTG